MYSFQKTCKRKSRVKRPKKFCLCRALSDQIFKCKSSGDLSLALDLDDNPVSIRRTALDLSVVDDSSATLQESTSQVFAGGTVLFWPLAKLH